MVPAYPYVFEAKKRCDFVTNGGKVLLSKGRWAPLGLAFLVGIGPLSRPQGDFARASKLAFYQIVNGAPR
jgi:hypothetical protein